MRVGAGGDKEEGATTDSTITLVACSSVRTTTAAAIASAATRRRREAQRIADSLDDGQRGRRARLDEGGGRETGGHKQLYWVERLAQGQVPGRTAPCADGVAAPGSYAPAHDRTDRTCRGGRRRAVRHRRPAARRATECAPELAGRWELPGGKVEPGEVPEDALVRELREELGVTAAPVARVPGEWPLKPGYVLRVWRCDLRAQGTPRPLQDHDELRWLAADEIWSVDRPRPGRSRGEGAPWRALTARAVPTPSVPPHPRNTLNAIAHHCVRVYPD